MGSIGMSLLWFVVIVAMIPAALWLMKRTPMGGAAAHGLLRTVAMLPMGPSQRVAIVEVGSGDDRRWLVLGLTGQHMSTLHTMAPQGEPVEMKGVDFSETPFGQMLAKLKGKADDK